MFIPNFILNIEFVVLVAHVCMYVCAVNYYLGDRPKVCIKKYNIALTISVLVKIGLFHLSEILWLVLTQY